MQTIRNTTHSTTSKYWNGFSRCRKNTYSLQLTILNKHGSITKHGPTRSRIYDYNTYFHGRHCKLGSISIPNREIFRFSALIVTSRMGAIVGIGWGNNCYHTHSNFDIRMLLIVLHIVGLMHFVVVIVHCELSITVWTFSRLVIISLITQKTFNNIIRIRTRIIDPL